MLQLSQVAADALDWTVVGLSAGLCTFGAFGAALTLPSCATRQAEAAKQFCGLWGARFLSQVVVVLLALAQLLRLQVLWGPHSVIIPGGFYPEVFCRTFTAVTYGLLEPTFLLLALFSCIYSVQSAKFEPHANSNIVFLAVGFSLPTCATQLVCALFTHLIRTDAISAWFYQTFFSTYDTHPAEYCSDIQLSSVGISSNSSRATDGGLQGKTDASRSSCAFCTFALLSTFASAAFVVCYMAVAWLVTQRIVACAISRVLRRRLRVLQLLVSVSLPLGVACRGLTAMFQPFDLAFEALRVGSVVCTVCTTLSMSYILVIKPVHEAHVADRQLLLFSPEAGRRGKGRWWWVEDGGSSSTSDTNHPPAVLEHLLSSVGCSPHASQSGDGAAVVDSAVADSLMDGVGGMPQVEAGDCADQDRPSTAGAQRGGSRPGSRRHTLDRMPVMPPPPPHGSSPV